ncbi:hypothetical protein L3V86_08330 [Thiotrichales bacterium 19S11-10]|nr:hypothetical protein [Thiotrichales bacterium 19S11-10]
MDSIKLSEKELEFLSQAALAFDNAIAEEKTELNYIAEITTFLIAIYGKNANLSDAQRQTLRDAYSILIK